MAPRLRNLWKLPNTHLSDGSVIRVTLIGTKAKVWWWAERTAQGALLVPPGKH
jgi:hypothetical protein